MRCGYLKTMTFHFFLASWGWSEATMPYLLKPEEHPFFSLSC